MIFIHLVVDFRPASGRFSSTIQDKGATSRLLRLLATRAADRGRLGSLLENYVAAEVAKQAAWAGQRVTLHHFRSYAGEEVDLVLEDPAGRVVGIPVRLPVLPPTPPPPTPPISPGPGASLPFP
jgi:hypothetical protein